MKHKTKSCPIKSEEKAVEQNFLASIPYIQFAYMLEYT